VVVEVAELDFMVGAAPWSLTIEERVRGAARWR